MAAAASLVRVSVSFIFSPLLFLVYGCDDFSNQGYKCFWGGNGTGKMRFLRPLQIRLRLPAYFGNATLEPVPELCRRPFVLGSGSMPNFNASAAILRRQRMTEVWERWSRAAISRTPKPSARQLRSWRSSGVSHFASKETISRALTSAGIEPPYMDPSAEVSAHSSAAAAEQRA